MPYKPKKPCAMQGCPKLTHETYCKEHKALRQKQYDKYKTCEILFSIKDNVNSAS